MEVRIIHLGEDYWLVRERGRPLGPIYRFSPSAPYRPLEFAADRSCIAYGDIIAVDEADLVPYSNA
jgi:hypothetical protein